MSTFANIVINNNAAVAKTFTAVSPSGGFGGVPALWQLKEGAHVGVFSIIKCSSKSTSNAKKVHWTMRFPYSYTDSNTGLVKAGSSMNVELMITVPDDYPEAAKLDPAAFVKNLTAHALFQETAKDGTSPT